MSELISVSETDGSALMKVRRLVSQRSRGVLALLLVAILALVIGYFVYQHYHNQNDSSLNKATSPLQQEEKRHSSVINESLNKGDVDNYLNSQLLIAGNYLQAKDYANADRVLSEVRQKVAADKLNSYAYQLFVQVDVHNNDVAKQKSDLQKLIPMLRQEHRDSEADSYQKQLDKL